MKTSRSARHVDPRTGWILLPLAIALPAAATRARGLDDLDQQPGVRITAEHEAAVDRGLAWLASTQLANGGWRGDVGFKLRNSYRVTTEERAHVGVTALAGMAFLAGGHLPVRGPYGDVVERALDFVLSCVQDDGYITFAGTRMYSHAFATLFLAEIYGVTHRDDVHLKLQKAVDFIVRSQNEQGGWRYVPLARDSDMSIVVCQVLALRAARNIGIRVPRSTIDRATAYVSEMAVKDDASARRGFRYRSVGLGTFHYHDDDRRTTFPLTAAGVTALHGLGIYSDELIRKGVDFLNREVDSFNRRWGESGHYFFWYGHYYGVQAMYTQGGHEWQRYFTQLRSFLLRRQRLDGSWLNPVGPGPAFGTAMAVLILEIPYCYLPIFQR